MSLERALQAAQQGNFSFIESISRADLTQLLQKSDEDGRTLVHAAAAAGQTQLLSYLLSSGGEQCVVRCDDEGWTPLHSAVSAGHLDSAKLLLDHGAEVDAATSGGRRALHYAASKQPTLIALLISHKASSNIADKTKSSPLHRACGAGKLDSVKALVQAKAKLNLKDQSGLTPLALAATCGHDFCSLWLASQGAAIEVQDADGDIPIKPQLLDSLKAVQAGTLDVDELMYGK